MKHFYSILALLFSINSFSQPWAEHSKHNSLDKQANDGFANAVAIDGNYAVVGARYQDYDASGGNKLVDAGAAYIFSYNVLTDVWTEETKLLAADRAAADEFGISVDISGDKVVIGAVGKDGAKGAAYVYEKNTSGTWVQVKKLEAPVRQSSDRFGHAVSISGDAVLIGAYHEDEGEYDTATLQNAGSAYVFNQSGGTWGFTQKIVASDRDVNDYFGYSVAINSSHLIVGAYQYNPDSIGATGGAYAFELIAGEWTEKKILRPLTPYKEDKFGWSVDLDGDFFIVGAPEHSYDLSGSIEFGAGAAFVFDAANSWGEIKIVHSDRNATDNFGTDVAINGSMAVVGTPNQDQDVAGATFWSNAGAAYVFEHSIAGGGSWTEKQKLVASINDRFSNDFFGFEVDISGINIISGAPGDNIDTPPTMPTVGAMCIFNKVPVTGIAQLENVNYKLYPNPVNQKLKIDFVDNANNYHVKITNLNGETLYPQFNNVLNTTTFHVNTLPAGIFFVNIQSNTGFFSSTKFVKVE